VKGIGMENALHLITQPFYFNQNGALTFDSADPSSFVSLRLWWPSSWSRLPFGFCGCGSEIGLMNYNTDVLSREHELIFYVSPDAALALMGGLGRNR